MKRTILIFLFSAMAAIAATAQPLAVREPISEDEYDEAIDAARVRADKFGQRVTYVWKYYSKNALTKTVTDVTESLPGGRFKTLAVTVVKGVVVKREERVVAGEKDYHRVNNGQWKITPIPELIETEMPAGYKPPVIEVKNEYFRVRPKKPGEPDIYIREQTTTTDGVPAMEIEKYSIRGGIITGFEGVNWTKTSTNITETDVRTYEHGVRGIKIKLPVFPRKTRR